LRFQRLEVLHAGARMKGRSITAGRAPGACARERPKRRLQRAARRVAPLCCRHDRLSHCCGWQAFSPLLSRLPATTDSTGRQKSYVSACRSAGNRESRRAGAARAARSVPRGQRAYVMFGVRVHTPLAPVRLPDAAASAYGAAFQQRYVTIRGSAAVPPA